MKRFFVIFILALSCGNNLVDLKKPIDLKMDSFETDIVYFFTLIKYGQYGKIYKEAFLPELKNKVKISEFNGKLKDFELKYGKLFSELSYIRSIEWSTEPFMFTANILLEYEKKTIYGSLIFSGSPDDMKIKSYRFTEN